MCVCIFLFIWGLCVYMFVEVQSSSSCCVPQILSQFPGARGQDYGGWPSAPKTTCHHFNMRTGTTGAQNCSSKFYVCLEDITEFLMSARQTLCRPRCLWEIIFQYHDNIIECGGVVYFCHYFTSLFDFAYFWSWISMFYIVKDDLNLWILLLPPLGYEGNGHELPWASMSSIFISADKTQGLLKLAKCSTNRAALIPVP